MNEKMKSLLTEAVGKYGEKQNILSSEELSKKWNVCVSEDSAIIPEATDIRVRSSIIGLGVILEENLEEHIYVTTVNAGFSNEALLVCWLNGDELLMIACAHEGFISQHLAEKAIGLVKERIEKLFVIK